MLKVYSGNVKTKVIEAFSIEEAIAKFKATARNSSKIIQIIIVDNLN